MFVINFWIVVKQFTGQIYDISSSFKMPFISPDYSKPSELNLIEYESGKRGARKKTGTLSSKNNQRNQNNQLGGGTINYLTAYFDDFTFCFGRFAWAKIACERWKLIFYILLCTCVWVENKID